MRGFAERLRPAHLQRLELPQRALEVAHSSGGVGLLQPLVLVGAFADAPAAEIRERPTRACHDVGIHIRMLCTECFEQVDQAQLQVPPFPHRLALAVALLPAVHAVTGRALALFAGRLRVLAPPARPQDALESVENIRDVVVELRSRERGARRQLGIGIRRGPPGGEQRLSPGGEVVGQQRQPVRDPFPCRHSHSVRALEREVYYRMRRSTPSNPLGAPRVSFLQ